MTLHSPIDAPAAMPNPGGATVGDLRAMPAMHALSVTLMRDWFDGAPGRARVAQVFTHALGPTDAGADAWADFARHIGAGTRRPVLRHATTCTCVGADEAVVAKVLDLAARGAREDAMLILALLIPGERLLLVLHDAERAGRAVLRLSRGLQTTLARRLH